MPGLTDNSLMPFGKHKGQKMANVPADYLLWIFENNKCTQEVANYIKENMDTLTFETNRKQK